MPAKLKVDQVESVDGSANITLNNSVTMASGKTLPAASLTGTLPAISAASLTAIPAGNLTGTVAVARIADGSITAAKLAADTATQAELDAVSTASLAKAGGTMTGDLVLNEITETEATSASATYTVDLANGTIFDLTSGSTCTVTMPSAEAGKSFTIVAAVPAAWSGTIKWSGGAAPTTGSGITIYSFISDGSNWYGMQAGTGFA
tara:strand:+ start:45 stop:659 length:615 start_codon:yes stop_codon:yes gene_type:complete